MQLDEIDPMEWERLEGATDDYITASTLQFDAAAEALLQARKNELFCAPFLDWMLVGGRMLKASANCCPTAGSVRHVHYQLPVSHCEEGLAPATRRLQCHP